MKQSEAEIAQLLTEKQIRPSYQRIALLAYLRQQNRHPTVDDIYRDLKSHIPTLSKSTIYNTLQLFCDHGLARALTIEEKEIRYDAMVGLHGHFKCDHCGRIDNFAIHARQLATDDLVHYQIRARDVYYRGLCPDCLKSPGNTTQKGGT